MGCLQMKVMSTSNNEDEYILHNHICYTKRVPMSSSIMNIGTQINIYKTLEHKNTHMW